MYMYTRSCERTCKIRVAAECLLWARRLQALPADIFDNELWQALHLARGRWTESELAMFRARLTIFHFTCRILEMKDIKPCPQCFCMFVLSGGKIFPIFGSAAERFQEPAWKPAWQEQGMSSDTLVFLYIFKQTSSCVCARAGNLNTFLTKKNQRCNIRQNKWGVLALFSGPLSKNGGSPRRRPALRNKDDLEGHHVQCLDGVENHVHRPACLSSNGFLGETSLEQTLQGQQQPQQPTGFPALAAAASGIAFIMCVCLAQVQITAEEQNATNKPSHAATFLRLNSLLACFLAVRAQACSKLGAGTRRRLCS